MEYQSTISIFFDDVRSSQENIQSNESYVFRIHETQQSNNYNMIIWKLVEEIILTKNYIIGEENKVRHRKVDALQAVINKRKFILKILEYSIIEKEEEEDQPLYVPQPQIQYVSITASAIYTINEINFFAFADRVSQTWPRNQMINKNQMFK